MDEVKGLYTESNDIRVFVIALDDTWITQDEMRQAAIELLKEEV